MSANGALLVSWYTTKVDVKFTQAARKHKVGRERALQAMHNASYTGEILMGGDAKKILWLGDDTIDIIEDYNPDGGDELIYLNGKPLTNEYAEQLATEAEIGYEPTTLSRLPGGRPSLSAIGDSPQIRFRVPAETRAKVEQIAAHEHKTVSQIAREALDRYLAAA